MKKLSWGDQRNSKYKSLEMRMGLGCSKERKRAAWLGVMSKGQYSRGWQGPDTAGF